MSSSDSQALTKRSAAGALMAPPPAPKRIKRPAMVLDEDTYVSAISHIVRRDFFPGLAEADAQREYLNALESKDKAWIRESGKKLTQAMTPVPYAQRRAAGRTRPRRRPDAGAADKTPSVWGADTPVGGAGTEAGDGDGDGDEDEDEDGDEDGDGLGKLDTVDLNLSLNAFQAKYTSEDQESFSAIVDKQNQKKFDKHAWLHDGNRYASKQRLAQQKLLAATAAADSTALAVRPSQNLDDRPAAPTMHRHTAFNTLMFMPDSVESWAPTALSRAEARSLAAPKHTVYANTRLPADSDPPPPRPASPTLSAIRDAVSGRPRLAASEGGYTGSETPRVNGYAFVDAHAPEPADDSDDAPEDLLERFGVSGSRATPFHMAEASDREKLHHKMVDSIAAKRAAPGTSGKPAPLAKGLGIFTSETPRFLSAPTPAQRLGAQTPGRKARADLTPAAQRLLDRMGKTPRPGGGGGGGFGSSSSKIQDWTPVSRGRKKT